MTIDVGRFAPSTTGPAHPGTLLAALLCWLDARSRGARVGLRLEDLDPERSSAERVDALRADLRWFGLDWDWEQLQSDRAEAHAAALDGLASAGLLYPCRCSRAEVRAKGARAADGSFLYPGTCRDRGLPNAGWRSSSEILRVRLPAAALDVGDESGIRLSPPGERLADPVVRRRDGAIAYQLATVVDDAESGVTRIVRGRDLAPSTAIQVSLQQLLRVPTPTYRHHLLLLEERGGKLAKLHGAVSIDELRAHYTAPQLCGRLAFLAGLRDEARPIPPAELVSDFAWERVHDADRSVRWTGTALELLETLPGPPR
jgi:glutamyl/glutaminyl-tRNA synthetase